METYTKSNRQITEQASSFNSSVATINMQPIFQKCAIGDELMRHKSRQNLSYSKNKTMNNFFRQRKDIANEIKSLHKNRISAAIENERNWKNKKKLMMQQKLCQKQLFKRPHRIYLSNIVNLEHIRKVVNCSRSKLKGERVYFDREIGKNYTEYDDNINREVKKTDLGYNLFLL